jgi:uncharacterized protein YndB with AHSA1/START domain
VKIPPILRSTHVHRNAEETFVLFTDRIGAWWPLRTHGLFGVNSGGLEFRDGRLVERSLTGEETVWGEVLSWEPPHAFAMTWHPGRTDGPASVVEVVFNEDEEGTRVELVHRGWEAFGDDAGLTTRDGYVGPGTWGAVLDHFTDIAGRLDEAFDLSALRAAYDAFFDEALKDGFESPEAGEWSAAQIVAHVAVNDDALSAACRGLIERATVRFDNIAATTAEVLNTFIGSASLTDLVAIGRSHSEQLLTLLLRLNPEQRDSEVHCHLRDGDTIAVDAPMPLSRIVLQIQPGFHLPSHTEQLRSLRR